MKSGERRNHRIKNILVLVVIFVYGMFFRKNEIFAPMNRWLGSYFDDGRLDMLVSLFSITIGIYTTITSILAISITKIMERILKEKKEIEILDALMWGLISNIIAVLFLVFLPEIQGGNILLFLVIIWASAHLIYFIIILFLIFRFNVSQMDKEIDGENEWKRDIKVNLITIQEDVKLIANKKKNSE